MILPEKSPRGEAAGGFAHFGQPDVRTMKRVEVGEVLLEPIGMQHGGLSQQALHQRGARANEPGDFKGEELCACASVGTEP